MPIIKRNALVAYSAQQMYELVNNIDDYDRFLPWCSQSQIIHHTENSVEAVLEISWAGIRKKFTTRNQLQPYSRININLVNGPFQSLVGYWQFIPLSAEASKVCLELEFEFTGNIMDKLFQPIFNTIANSLVDAFCKRSIEVYGH
jgi:ribosome-associated toxin RatA of RatAB toxin-antitoxin module